MARSLTAAEVRDAASAIAALYTGVKKLSKADGWMSAAELANIWECSEGTARSAANRLCEEGKMECAEGRIVRTSGKFYRPKK